MALVTLFVVLPTEEVCTLRGVRSGSRVRDIRSRLEVCAGLPGQVYNFTSRNGQVLDEDLILELGFNVWEGFLLRAELKEGWKPLLEAVHAGELDFVLRDRLAHLQPGIELPDDKKQCLQFDEERECVALYLASWIGSVRICQGLLAAGVDPNSETPYQRTPLFAVVARDNHYLMEVLLKHGALLSVRDCNGDTPLDIAKRNFSMQCINRIRRLMKDQLRIGSNTSSGQFNTTFSETTRVLSFSANTVANFTHRNRPFTAKERPNNKQFMKTRSKSDSSFNKRFVAFKEQEQEPHRSEVINIPSEDNSFVLSEPVNLPRSFTPNSLESNDSQQPKQPSITPKNAEGTVLKVSMSIPNFNKEKHYDKVHDVTIHNGLQAKSDFLRVKSALIEGRHKNQLIHSEEASDRSCNSLVVKDDTTIRCPNTEVPDKNHSSVQDNETPSPGVEKETNDAKLDVGVGESGTQLEGTCIKGDGQDDMFRKKKHKRKRAESMKTALRQIQLAEHQKRTSSAKGTARQTFELWLKRKQELEQQSSSPDDSGDSSAESTNDNSKSSFPAWLKQIRDRPKYRQTSANSLNYGKTRAIEGLVQIHNPNADQSLNASQSQAYMHAYRDWREGYQNLTESKIILDAKEAKRVWAEKRQQMLATAITYNEWMTYCEERKYLMSVINQSESHKLFEIEKAKLAQRTIMGNTNKKCKEGLEKFGSIQRGQVYLSQGHELMPEKPTKIVSFYDDVQTKHDFGNNHPGSHSSNKSLNKTRTKT